MSAEDFKKNVSEIRTTMRQMMAASADEDVRAAVRLDTLSKNLGEQMKTLEAMDRSLWSHNKDEVVTLMAELAAMAENMTKRQDKLRTRMTQLTQRIKAQNSYGQK